MSELFQPLSIRSITFRNRIAVSPMCEYSSVDGFANDWHLVHLGSRAVGGAGLIITEATAVVPEGRISPDDLGIWKDEHIEFLKRITSFIKLQGSIPGIQLAHAGRKASHSAPWKGSKQLLPEEGGWQTVGPSAISYAEGETAPKEMSIEEIKRAIENFAAAAKRAVAAGFKVIELHGAHGYLLHEFLSPLSNQRTDEYGGSFENRIRFLLEVTDAVRKVIGTDLPLFVRISASDWVEGGWTINDSVELSEILNEHTVDLIDCSSGGNSRDQKIIPGPMYQVPFAQEVKQRSGTLTGAVGLITTAQEAENIIANKQADLVFMARQLLRDPYFPLQASKELDGDCVWPKQYERAKN